MNLLRLVSASLLLAMLAACATPSRYPPPQRMPPPSDSSGAPAPWPASGESRPDAEPGAGSVAPEPEPEGPPPPRTVAEASGPAVVALLGQADTKAREGQPEQAAAYVERAVAVEPRNPFIFQRLAALRLDQGEPEQAEAMARKSNSLAGDNPYVRAGNWKLIAEARQMRGDAAGAAEARSRSQVYLSQTRGR
ncbi:MAG: hypothetical protein CMN28_03205 [Salinisphaeraceae bacterium]|jgi:tetratricopeptide (TPR) repeat protein|nr:hypothetical protein [Salinisphaeraceae bacterium]